MKYTRDGQPIVLYKRVILTGDHITDSTSSTDEYNQPQVNISLDSAGGTSMSNSPDNIGKPMATLFVEYKDSGKKDGRAVLVKQEEVINVANIQSRLGQLPHHRYRQRTKRVSFRCCAACGRADRADSDRRRAHHRSNHRSAEHHPRSGSLSWGLVASIVFMVVWYRKFGVIATTALVANTRVLIVGVMSLLPGRRDHAGHCRDRVDAGGGGWRQRTD